MSSKRSFEALAFCAVMCCSLGAFVAVAAAQLRGDPVGACCLNKGFCSAMSLAACESFSGTYLGDGTSCAGSPCDGACCTFGGSCYMTNSFDCTVGKGSFQGEGTTCGEISCPGAIGACCFTKGCQNVTQDDCIDNFFGVYMGDGTTCAEITCPEFGACCYPDGTCVDYDNSDNCPAFGGVFHGEGSFCDPGSRGGGIICPQPGACCLPDGACRQETEIGGAQCEADGGFYDGDDTICGLTTTCGACCSLSGECHPASQPACVSLFKGEHHPGLSCGEIACTGACCFGDGSCSDLVDLECGFQGGEFQGEGNSCAQIDCLAGIAHNDQKISETHSSVLDLDPFDEFGASVARIGDLNSDGVVDIAVGAPGDDGPFSLRGDTNHGAIWILFMNSDGTPFASQKIGGGEGGFGGSLGNFYRFGQSIAALGDLDGDNVVDLAVGAPGDGDGFAVEVGAVWILFMNPDGTVKTEQKITAGVGGLPGVLDYLDEFGQSVASLGDIDGDGINDIAVGATGKDLAGSSDNGAVYVLFMDTDGTVQTHLLIGSGEGGFVGGLGDFAGFGSSSAAIGDLNRDGAIDMIVGAPGQGAGGHAHVLFLDSSGSVIGQQAISEGVGGFEGEFTITEAFGQSVAFLGDLDGDGDGDVVVGAPQHDMPTFRGTDPEFPFGALWVLFMNDDGTVGGFREISHNTNQLPTEFFGFSVAYLGDIDGDARPEIVAGCPGDDDGGTDQGAVWVLFLLGATDVEFEEPQTFEAAGEAKIEAVGNLDGPGGERAARVEQFVDVVTVIPDANPANPGKIEIFQNLGNDTDWLGLLSTGQITVGANPSGVAIGFFNGDDFLDLAIANAHDGTITILLNNGVAPPAFTPSTLITGLNNPSAITSADFNDDGFWDLAVVNKGTNEVLFYENDGSWTIAGGGRAFTNTTSTSAPPDSDAIEPEDLDGDKDTDVVVLGRTSGQASTVRNNNTNVRGGSLDFEVVNTISVGENPRDLAIGDIDGNGYPDIITANSSEAKIAIIPNSGDFDFEPVVKFPVGVNPLSVDVGSFYTDGTLDIAVVANDADVGPAVQILQNQRGELTTLDLSPPVAFQLGEGISPNFVVAVDLDNSGRPDLVTVNNDTEAASGGSVSALLLLEQPACPGDVVPLGNGDGAVTMSDVLAVLKAFGPCPEEPEPCPFDIVPPGGDGNVSVADVTAVMTAYGQCPTN